MAIYRATGGAANELLNSLIETFSNYDFLRSLCILTNTLKPACLEGKVTAALEMRKLVNTVLSYCKHIWLGRSKGNSVTGFGMQSGLRL